MNGVLNLTLYPLSGLARRSGKRWVFGHQGGTFSGNAKYLFIWMALNRSDINVIWLTDDEQTRRNLNAAGYTSYAKWSWQGVLTALHSGVFVFCHSIDDVHLQLSRGALLLNLWHGVGLKTTQLGDKGGVISRHQKYRSNFLTQALYLDFLTMPDLVATTSDVMQRHFATQFGLSEERCPQLGYPRLDVAADSTLLAAAKKIDPCPEVEASFEVFDEVYMYMPTYRDTGRPFLDEALPDLDRLSAVLRARNALLYIKMHPRTAANFASTHSNIKLWPSAGDVYHYLNRFSVLITDYSSILYDYIFTQDKGAILYTFDFQEYTTKDRSLLYPFEENVVGIQVSNFEDLCACLSDGAALRALPAADVNRIRERFWGNCVAPVSPHIVDYIEAQVSASRKGRSGSTPWRSSWSRRAHQS